MKAVRLVLLAALAAALYGQTKPKDVDGWDKIKWGMTIAEARSVYGVENKLESNEEWTLLKLKPVKIGGVDLDVEAAARRGSEKISSVRLWSYFGTPNSRPDAGPQDFEALRAILIQKYGTPTNEEAKRGENFRELKTVLWRFDSSSILMTLEQSSSIPGIGNILLDYTANQH